ncbi:TPA: hypothetical protein SMF79_000102 [Serratia marcescens]|nr:hypothetical protein [Serratia marcescens]HEJ8127187.1 hypothetical protein [Serratia marcescens]
MRLNNAVFAPPALSKEKDMGGFNYGGGKGDGTDWSSEKGDTPEPGGGSNGNGGRDSGNDNSQAGAFQRQMTAVLNDPAIKSMLADL